MVKDGNTTMQHASITLFRDFAEDQRLSMEIYADRLSQAMQTYFSERYQVHEYQPSLLPWLGQRFSNSLLRMRVSRFLAYPWQARRHQRQINHIVDHGYGHLLYMINPGRTVVTVHDLIPWVHWRGEIPVASIRSRPWLNLLSFNALRRAGHLIAISENTRRDLVRLCRCNPEKITVVYYGIASTFRPYTQDEKMAVRQKWGVAGNRTKRVLVSGSQFYKNQSVALKAFARLRELFLEPLEIVKTGMPNPEWTRAVKEHRLEKEAKCLGVVEHERMAEVYNSVNCLLFPSLYEGFGRPPLEAMACGTPVVASNAASLPEVIGEAGLMVNPEDEEGLAQAMHAVLTNDELRQSLIKRGLSWAQKFTWQKAAHETLKVYEKIAHKNLSLTT